MLKMKVTQYTCTCTVYLQTDVQCMYMKYIHKSEWKMKVHACNYYSQNHNNILFHEGVRVYILCIYLSVEVSLPEKKSEHHCLEVFHQVVAEVVKLRQQNVVESLAVLAHLLSFLLLQRGEQVVE